MRCLAIADALHASGIQVNFVLSDANPVDIICERGYKTLVLQTNWRLVEEGIEELQARCMELSEAPVVLIDTYSVTASYVERLAQCAKVCYLGSKDDNLGNLSLLVDYSTDVDKIRYETFYSERKTKLLLGPLYAPIRTQFASAYKKRSGAIRRVLVTTGNTDPWGFIPEFLYAALESQVFDGITFAIVVGSMFNDKTKIEDIAVNNPRIELHCEVADMVRLMSTADIAVSANGTTVYEMAAIGLPVVTFAMVQEQIKSAESLGACGATAYAGAFEGTVKDIVRRVLILLKELVSYPETTLGLADRAHALVDGLGADRIAREIIAL
nr:UDP-2,4-diacetamido-2,4,6-trideoxy-beta-L-altropyranose hydrolase [Eggerthella sp. YY7918]